jgi:hypothetical protein
MEGTLHLQLADRDRVHHTADVIRCLVVALFESAHVLTTNAFNKVAKWKPDKDF